VEIKFFFNFFLVDGKFGSVQIMTDPDQYPEHCMVYRLQHLLCRNVTNLLYLIKC